MIGVALGLAFLLELVAFIAIADLGLLLPGPLAVRAAAFTLLLAGIVVFWSVYMAPKAPRKLKTRNYYLAKSIIYGVSAVSLAVEQTMFLATCFVAAALFSERIIYKHNLQHK